MKKNLSNRFFQLGLLPSDDKLTIETKSILKVLIISMSIGAILFSSILLYLDLLIPAITPLVYILISITNLFLFNKLKDLKVARIIQLAISILLPFIGQWQLGGFEISGGVMLWALLGLISSVILYPTKRIFYWLMMFLGLFIFSIFIDPICQSNAPEIISQDVSLLLMYINFAFICSIVFLLAQLKVRADMRLRLVIENKNKALNTITSNLEKTNYDLRNFSFVISNDLKSPLRAISNLLAFILSDEKSTLSRESNYQMRMIKNRIKYTYKLIDDILEYSNIKEEKLSKKLVNTHELVKSLVEKRSHPENIKINISPDLPNIWYDEEMLSQVFQALISNAIKYTNQTDGIIEIDASVTANVSTFSIRDNGIGIDNKYKHKIFELFQTLEKVSEEDTSTGIGLAIAKKIVELHGGNVWFESMPDNGATFYFTIPQTESEDSI